MGNSCICVLLALYFVEDFEVYMLKIVLASSINKFILAMGWFSDFGRAQRVLGPHSDRFWFW